MQILISLLISSVMFGVRATALSSLASLLHQREEISFLIAGRTHAPVYLHVCCAPYFVAA